jgi:hypothetical protein
LRYDAAQVKRPLTLLLALSFVACRPTGRSVRAWIESRDPAGQIVAGATVDVDGQPFGLTDQRGLFRLKIRRSVGTRVALEVHEERAGGFAWSGSFTVGTDGQPVESPGGRIVAVLGPSQVPAPTPTPPGAVPPSAGTEQACSKDDEKPCLDPFPTKSPFAP